MRKLEKNVIIKYGLGVFALTFAILRLINIEGLSLQIDNTFLLLFMIATILFILPIEKIKTFKAAGVELELLQSKVQGALEGLSLKYIDNKQILETINNLNDNIVTAKNSRILWIDDKPHEVLGERRLLRALGLEIITANDQKTVNRILELDNDYDLIISDIQWRDPENPDEVTYGGIDKIKDLRNKYKGKAIGSLQVIFYTAYRKDQIEIIQSQTNFKSIENIQICFTIEELIYRVINTLAKIRTNPIKVKSKKKAT